ncbi:MAG: YkvA family protein [Chloroflexia bacterium]
MSNNGSNNTAKSPSGGSATLASLVDNGRLTWRLLQDDRVPTVLKVVIPLVVAVYFISPLDLIPDFIPVLGQLDDLGVILLGTSLLIHLAPRDVVNEHRASLGMPPMPTRNAGPPGSHADTKTRIIDGTYHTEDRT